MKCFLLQDWVDISGPTAAGNVIQSESGWLDLSGYRDVIAWLDIRETTPASPSTTPTVLYQTAVTKDDGLFTTVATVASPLSTGVTLTTILQDTATVPVARWFRWQIQGAGPPWDLCFRIWLAASCPGRRKLNAARGAAATAR